MGNTVTIAGIADVNRILREIAPNEARNLMRATITELAKNVALSAREKAPAEEGDLKAGIRHKRERGKRDLLASSAGVHGPAFYWRFLEYGQGPDGVEHAFFRRAVKEMEPDLEPMYLRIFGQKLENRLARLRKNG